MIRKLSMVLVLGGIAGYAAVSLAGDDKAKEKPKTIVETAVTRNVCARPEGVMKQERIFLKALATVTFARMDGDSLELRSRDGGLAVKAARSDGIRSASGAISRGEARVPTPSARP